ncbi:MAG: glycerate kinase [Clostridia bacterium]|nr:glycerate kinase [Clostridia bacterium]
MSHILICPDSFKGSISAPDAAAALCRGITAARPDAAPIPMPIADGGEGTLDALCPPDARVVVMVHDALGRSVTAQLGLLGQDTAVIEMAQAAGVTQLAEGERNPLLTSTYGVGEMILAALDRGCRKLLITVGGSATNDGGSGMMAALGLRLLDADGRPIQPCGGSLGEIAAIDVLGLDPRLAECTVTVATDVTNPLCGERGATAVYGPQKGADTDALVRLEAGMMNLGRMVDEAVGRSVSTVPGCGAGGGLPLGLIAFTPARICSGIDAVLDTLDFDAKLDGCAFVISGEGRTDGQSACGKAVAGIARRAQAKGVPVYVLSGSLKCDDTALDALEAAGVRGVMSILDAPCTLEDAMQNAEPRLVRAGSRLARMLIPADPREAGLRHAVAHLCRSGAACVSIHPGDAPRTFDGSGIAPIVRAMREDLHIFEGCAVADKIVGLAAAYLFANGGAAAVHGNVMSRSAADWLRERGIVHSADEVVEKIINRRGDGICPMEQRALALVDPAQAWDVFNALVE